MIDMSFPISRLDERRSGRRLDHLSGPVAAARGADLFFALDYVASIKVLREGM